MKSPAQPLVNHDDSRELNISETTSTRDRILSLAVRAIDNGGEAGLRVSDIAISAGVTIPTLYRHFGSREGLIEAAQMERFNRDRGTDFDTLSDKLNSCASQEELKELIRAVMMTRFDNERRAVRHARVNSLGSGYARPDLMSSLAASQRVTASAMAELLRPFQERGWIRPNVDLVAFVYWYLGQLMGRVLIEISGEFVSEEDWNETSLAAVTAILFGDTPFSSTQ